MIDGRKVLALIPARGGSKRLPGKNVRPLQGAPLIAWSVRAALASGVVDRVVVSSDDPAAIAAAVEAGAEAPFVRPDRLATDEASTADVVLHALSALEETYDILVLLQPTSPLRRADDIDAVVGRLVETGAPCALSVSRIDKPLSWIWRADREGRLHEEPTAWPETAEDEALCRPNGAVYALWTDRFREDPRFIVEGAAGVETPYRRAIDIDTLEDFRLAEALAAYAAAG